LVIETKEKEEKNNERENLMMSRKGVMRMPWIKMCLKLDKIKSLMRPEMRGKMNSTFKNSCSLFAPTKI